MTTVRKFAGEIGSPVEKTLADLQAAGMGGLTPDSPIELEHKVALLEYLKLRKVEQASSIDMGHTIHDPFLSSSRLRAILREANRKKKQ